MFFCAISLFLEWLCDFSCNLNKNYSTFWYYIYWYINEHNNLEFQLITEIEPLRILMIVHYVWYSNSVWFRIICVIFMQQILLQSVDTFFQYLYTIKCFITVRVDWFPFTEQHLKKDKLLSDNNRILFNTHPYYGGGIEDDHIPFLHRSKSSKVFFRLPPLTKTVHTFIIFSLYMYHYMTTKCF